MVRIELAALLGRLNATCVAALEMAASLCIQQRASEVTVAHVLVATLDSPLGDTSLLLEHGGIPQDAARQALIEMVEPTAAADACPVFSPLLVEWLQEAWLLSSLELDQETVRGGALWLTALLNPARYLPSSARLQFVSINRETLRTQFNALFAQSSETPRLSPSTRSDVLAASHDSALNRYGRDMTAMAREGRIDPVLCRDREIDQIIDVLARRRKNNPMAVGDAGVGKSAVVEGLALRIVEGQVPEALRGVSVWELDLGALQAGASVKGEFEKRLKAVMDEVRQASPSIILFIDEAHTLIGAGNAAGGSDAANLLKPALARGELRTIAATTWSEYKKYIEKDPALSRRFQLIALNEPSPEQAVHILRGLRERYEQSHGVIIVDEALHAAVELSARYLTGRQLPDKAIDVLDTACARVATAWATLPAPLRAFKSQRLEVEVEQAALVRDAAAGRRVDPRQRAALDEAKIALDVDAARCEVAASVQKTLIASIQQGRDTDGSDSAALTDHIETLAQLHTVDGVLHALDVDRAQIAQVIADWTGIPIDRLHRDQLERLDQLPTLLRAKVKGQDAAITQIHRRLLTAMADLKREGTPLGVFLLVGPSGVGKTETALGVADTLFGGPAFLTTINLSEYQEKHTVSRLLGAPPGYVGYGEGGLLTEAIRQRPYSVVLLDEAEKAHPDVLNVFYQAFDKGELADGEGRLVDCRNVVFFLTSNLGFDHASTAQIEADANALQAQLMTFFKPALLARMQVVPYGYLDEAVLAEIVEMRLARVGEQLQKRHGASLVVGEAARHELRARCRRHVHGARLLDASIEGDLLPPLSLAVLKRLAEGQRISEARLDWVQSGFTADVA